MWHCDYTALGAPAFALLASSAAPAPGSSGGYEGLPLAVYCRYRRRPEVVALRQRDAMVAAAVGQAGKRLGVTLIGVGVAGCVWGSDGCRLPPHTSPLPPSLCPEPLPFSYAPPPLPCSGSLPLHIHIPRAARRRRRRLGAPSRSVGGGTAVLGGTWRVGGVAAAAEAGDAGGTTAAGYTGASMRV